MSEPRVQRRAFQSAMSQGLRSAFPPASGGSRLDEFVGLLQKADRGTSTGKA